MKNYNSIIGVSKSFVPAIRVGNHLNDVNKLKDYIPTNQSMDILRNFCINEHGSNVIIGPYGSGKSHLITLIANIMSGKYNREDYYQFYNKISETDEETAELFKARINSGYKRFVIIPSYSSSDFEQAILIGVEEALHREGFTDIIVNSSFSMVMMEIEKWKKEFPETYFKFETILEKEYFININTFTEEIKNYNREYYKTFTEIYPRLTSGARFFHYDLNDVVGILKEVNNKMMGHGYRGTDIIFDEFGSFLENNIEKINISLIQDIAEVANDSDNNMSLYLITHKDLSQYGHRISNEIVIEWRKVEGRFRRFILEQSPTDIYELFSNVIVRKDGFQSFFNTNRDTFTDMKNKISTLTTFKDLSDKEISKYLVEGCFPLAPLSVFALYKLANKVAQSNRTIFTFLLSNDENSFGNFIDNAQETFWISGVRIYDYFEHAIWSESKESNLYKTWSEVNEGINKAADKKIYIDIIKVVGLIYIIDDFDRLKPNIQYISLLLPDYHEKEITKALDDLTNKKILLFRKIYGYYKFYEGSDLDLQEYLQKSIASNKDKIDYINILNQYFLPLPLIPRRHNDKFYMNRYMECRFINASELNPTFIKEELSQTFKDGIIYYVIPDEKKKIEAILQNISSYKDFTNVIVLLPRVTVDIEAIALKYWAILNALDDIELLERESFLEKELFLHEEELSREIDVLLAKYFNNEFKNVYVLNKGKVLSDVNNRYTLQKKASLIMDHYFKHTVKINNEMVNKDKLTPTMKSLSRKVINKIWGLIKGSSEVDFKEFSAEDTLIRTVFINTNLMNFDEKNTVQLTYRELPANNNLRLVLDEMEKYLESCREKEQNFYDIYKVLKQEPYGIKDGIIPLLFSVAIIGNLDNIFIKRNGVYEDLDGKLLLNMVSYPERYLVSIDLWDDEKENYILGLENIFRDYIDYEYRTRNRLGSLYKGIKKYYIGLPKFTRETNLVSENTQKIRNIISSEETDFKSIFFNKLAIGDPYDKALDNVKEAKNELDNFIEEFQANYSKEVSNIFNKSGKSIRNSIDKWLEQLEANVRNHMFDLKTNLFLKYIERPEKQYLRGLMKVLTGFDLEFITDEIADECKKDLIEIKERLENIETIKNDTNEAIQIDIRFNDIRKTKYLDEVELSSMGKILENKINGDIENFNYSLKEEEKAYILIKILKEII